MKVLKVSEIIDGTDQLIKKKEHEQKQIAHIKKALNNIVGLDDALKGEGGEAIRRNFSTVHMPVLLALDQFLEQYIQRLKDIQNKVKSYESEDGLVREHFIDHDVKNVLNKIKGITDDSVKAINNHFSKVSDLVTGSEISSEQLDSEIAKTKQDNQDTVDKLNKLDHESKSELDKSEDTLKQISQLVEKVNEWSKGGPFLKGKQVQEVENYLESSPISSTLKDAMKSKRNKSINFKDNYKELSNIARAKNNSIFTNPMDTVGYNPDEPIKSAGTLMTEGYGAFQAGKQGIIKVRGGSVSKEKYTTAQGIERYRLKVKDPNDSFGLKKKSYPSYGLKKLNRGKLRSAHALISPKSALSESFSPKTVSGKLGYAGLGISAVSDITQGINKHQSGSRITGNVVGDTAVGVTSILASASVGAYAGAMAGSWAGPVGMAVGFGMGMLVNYALSGVKPFHGKSVKDVVSNAVTKATNKVKHFFGHLF